MIEHDDDGDRDDDIDGYCLGIGVLVLNGCVNNSVYLLSR